MFREMIDADIHETRDHPVVVAGAEAGVIAVVEVAAKVQGIEDSQGRTIILDFEILLLLKMFSLSKPKNNTIHMYHSLSNL